MTNFDGWTDEQRKAWEEWVATRPPVIQEMCRLRPINTLYRVIATGQMVMVRSYCEDGTLTLFVLSGCGGEAFGFRPEDLEEL